MAEVYQTNKPSNSSNFSCTVERLHIKEVYFAKREKDEIIYKQGTNINHKIVKNDTLSGLAKKYNITEKEIKGLNGLKNDKIQLGKTLIISKKEKEGVNVKFTRINDAIIGDEAYLIVKTEKADNLELNLKICQAGDKKIIEDIDKPITIQYEGNDVTEFKATVGGFCEKEVLNHDDFKDMAIAKITFAPKDKDKLKKWTDALKAIKDKTTPLYVLVDAHTGNSFLITYYGTDPDGKDKLEHETVPNRYLFTDSKQFKLKKIMPVIVVDPGHGGTKGNTGATYIKGYKHKVKGKNGKVVKEGTPLKEKIVFTSIDSLPAYLSSDIKKEKDGWVWVTKRVYDNSKLERDLVWNVGEKLVEKIKADGFPVYLSRENKIIQGREDRKKRNTFGNNKKADYFISIHADGDYNPAKSGSHVIYREKKSDLEYNKIAKEFAVDVFSKYTVTAKHNSPKKDIRGLQVLSPSSNKAKRKVLIELGYMTNTNDYNSMTGNIDKIANEIFEGLKMNIDKNF